MSEPQGSAKTCSKCGETKPLEQFSPYRKGQRQRRPSCKACETVAHREWRLANLDRRAAYMRGWKAQHAERWDAYMRAWLDRHPSYKQDWEARNADARREAAVEWRARNRHLSREYTRRYRARKLSAPFEDIDPLEVFVRDGGLCGICGDLVDPDQWEIDHIRPLSRGGHHIASNVQVAHPRCNKAKGAKWPTSSPLMLARAS